MKFGTIIADPPWPYRAVPKSPTAQGYSVEQYDSLSMPDLKALSSFYKQAQNMSYGSDAQLEWFTRAWVAFDPKGTERTRIQLKTRAVPLEEAREVIHTATAGNFK